MRLSIVNRQLCENVEKLRPYLERYICNLIAAPYKKFIADYGSFLKEFLSSVPLGGDSPRSEIYDDKLKLSKLYWESEESSRSPYSMNGIIHFAKLQMLEDIPQGFLQECRRLIDFYQSFLMSRGIISRSGQAVAQPAAGRRNIFAPREGDTIADGVYFRYMTDIIDGKRCPPHLVDNVLDADPIASRDRQRGLTPDAQKAPFAKAIARWAYDPQGFDHITLPEDRSAVIDQLQRFNIAKSKGLNYDIDKIADYGQFIDIMVPYMQDMAEVDKFDLAGLKLLTKFGTYRIYILDDFNISKDIVQDSGWCVKNNSNFISYGPPFYLVVKGAKKLALLHVNSNQFKDVYNRIYSGADRLYIFFNWLKVDGASFVEFVGKMHANDGKAAGDFQWLNQDKSFVDTLTQLANIHQMSDTLALLAYDLDQVIAVINNQGYPKDLVELSQKHNQIFNILMSKLKGVKPAAYSSHLLNNSFSLSADLPILEQIISKSNSLNDRCLLYNQLKERGGLSLTPIERFSPIPTEIKKNNYHIAQNDRVLKAALDLVGYSEIKDDPEVQGLVKKLCNEAASFSALTAANLILFFKPAGLESLVEKIITTITGMILRAKAAEKSQLAFKLASLKKYIGMEEGKSSVADTYNMLIHLNMSEDPAVEDDIKKLESDLLDKNLLLAVQYAAEVKGPWKELEKRLLKANDSELLKQYQQDVLFGEEYEQ